MSTVVEEMRQPEPCTSWARRKRHYSDNLRPYSDARRGRAGIALCGAGVVDQERVDYWEANNRHTDISTLPECKKCVRRLR